MTSPPSETLEFLLGSLSTDVKAILAQNVLQLVHQKETEARLTSLERDSLRTKIIAVCAGVVLYGHDKVAHLTALLASAV